MEKLHFSSMAILFALFTMVSFTACSSDDDETPSTEDIKTNIIGKWQLTHVSGWQYDNTEDDLIKVDQDIPEKQGKRLLFKGDGTYKKYWYSGISGWYSPGYTCNKYEVSGNKIILYTSSGTIEETVNVVLIKGDVVIFETTLEEGPQYKQRITYKRIN